MEQGELAQGAGWSRAVRSAEADPRGRPGSRTCPWVEMPAWFGILPRLFIPPEQRVARRPGSAGLEGAMLSRSTPIGEGALRRLHPDTLEDPLRIRALLVRARHQGAAFHRGLNTRIDLETAHLEEVLDDELLLRATNWSLAPFPRARLPKPLGNFEGSRSL